MNLMVLQRKLEFYLEDLMANLAKALDIAWNGLMAEDMDSIILRGLSLCISTGIHLASFIQELWGK